MDGQDLHGIAFGRAHVQILTREIVEIFQKRGDIGMFLLLLLDQFQQMHEKSLVIGEMREKPKTIINADDKLVQRVQPDVAKKIVEIFLPDFFEAPAKLHIHVGNPSPDPAARADERRTHGRLPGKCQPPAAGYLRDKTR